jgi:S-formylglutathione hydrolase FrmB
MKRSGTFAILLLILLAVPPVVAQQATKQSDANKVIYLKIPAPSLKGNLLGEPTEQEVAVYLPPSYQTSATKRYPVLYLLHGYGGNPRTWFGTGQMSFNIVPILDELMSTRKAREMIVVAPNGANAFGGSFYVNSVASGNWEDFIVRDVVGYVDSNYRTLARAASRGIAGHSMGGYGAIHAGIRNAEVFSAVYALSPCCLGLEGEFVAAAAEWKRLGTIKTREQMPKPIKSFEDFLVTAFTGAGVAFAPNTDRAPFYSDPLYFEREGTLRQDEAVAAKWKSKMPLYMVVENKSSLRSLRGIFLDYGEKEEFSHIRITTARFSLALSESGIPHVFEVYPDGDHSSKVRERMEKKLVAFFSDKLDFSTP